MRRRDWLSRRKREQQCQPTMDSEQHASGQNVLASSSFGGGVWWATPTLGTYCPTLSFSLVQQPLSISSVHSNRILLPSPTLPHGACGDQPACPATLAHPQSLRRREQSTVCAQYKHLHTHSIHLYPTRQPSFINSSTSTRTHSLIHPFTHRIPLHPHFYQSTPHSFA